MDGFDNTKNNRMNNKEINIWDVVQVDNVEDNNYQHLVWLVWIVYDIRTEYLVKEWIYLEGPWMTEWSNYFKREELIKIKNKETANAKKKKV